MMAADQWEKRYRWLVSYANRNDGTLPTYNLLGVTSILRIDSHIREEEEKAAAEAAEGEMG